MKDEKFVIKAYGKTELAMKYFPKHSPSAAADRFRDWLKVNPKLRHLVTKKIHVLTPAQVKLIIKYLGKPFELED